MLIFAKKEFELDKKVKDSKATLREHLLVVQEQTGITPEELDNPEPSPAVSYLLGYFYELSKSRQAGMALNPIAYTEIEAWKKLFSVSLSQWEIRVIKDIDLIFLSVQNKE